MSHEQECENAAVAVAVEEHVSSMSAASRRTLLVRGPPLLQACWRVE
jgi:hypothetical protein